MRQITDIIVHHSASTWGCANEIDEWHRDRGWDEVGYHWIICNGVLAPDMPYNQLFDGMLERGRRTSQQGAHWKRGNAHSIGVCLIGSGEYTNFQLMKLSELLLFLIDEHGVSAGKVRGHYEVDPGKPECPMIDMARLRQKISRREFVFEQGDVWRT
jgi:hypothetical protein